MNQRKPPALADWLLRRFQVAESIAGDLHEEFQNGRSRAWYWRQVLAAVANTRTGAAKGIVIGWLTQLPVIVALWAIDIPPRPLNPFVRATGLLLIPCAEWLFARKQKHSAAPPHWDGFWRSLYSMWCAMSFQRTPETIGRLAFYEAEVLLVLLLGTLWMDTRRSPRLPLNK